jgi:hypothetical protein
VVEAASVAVVESGVEILVVPPISAVATVLFTRTEALSPFFVPASTVAEPSGGEALASTCAGTSAAAVEALACAAASPTGVEASTVAETPVPVDAVASTEADGVETSTLASVPSVDTSAVAEAGPRFTDTDWSDFFGGPEPAAALCAVTANPTSATTTRDTSARIRAAADTRTTGRSGSLERVIFRQEVE